jgi:hypothetical protein
LFIAHSGEDHYLAGNRREPMKKETKPPRAPKESSSNRPSHERVIENLDKWANSPGLQPPK